MFVLISSVLMMSGQVAPPTDPTSSRWSLKVDPAHCQLERRNAAAAQFLSIDTVPGSDSYRVLIGGIDSKGPATLTRGALHFAPSEKSVTGLVSGVRLSDGTMLLRLEGLPPELLDDLAEAESMSVLIKSRAAGSVLTPGAAKAVAALRGCSAGQLIDWGADAGQFAPGGRLPVALTSRDDWIANRDLMALATKSTQADTHVTFRIGITAGGGIEDCHPVTASSADVTKIACAAVVGKTLFSPARDAGGRPVRGVATFDINVMRRPS
ncbi:MAG: hypothetical protein ACK4ZY_07800 [Sphingomonas sp.]